MKVYKPIVLPETHFYIIIKEPRVKGKKEKALYISVEETTFEELIAFCRESILKSGIGSIFKEGQPIYVWIRPYHKGRPVKGGKQFSIYGTTIQECHNVILAAIENQ